MYLKEHKNESSILNFVMLLFFREQNRFMNMEIRQ